MIPIARPDLGSEEIAAVTEVLGSGMVAQGRKVAELEGLWADFVGVRHAIAVGNGTLALMAIFAGIGLEPGDEVITVSHTFAATANAILSTGATPVFVDIRPDTYLIDAKRIEAAITPRTGPSARIHLWPRRRYGHDPAIADRHGLIVVEDACQAHGATFRDRKAGSFGHGAFSLYATKNMTGRGGFVTDQRRSPPPTGCGSTETRDAVPLPVRDARLQLPPHRSGRRHRHRPVRQARAEHDPATGDRGGLR
jgi:dTDP-4-amino-4,6-dideoxygalactose transaminase